jgi:hypothetical protein
MRLPHASALSTLIGSLAFTASASVWSANVHADPIAAPAAWDAPNWSQADALNLARSPASQALVTELRAVLQTAPDSVVAMIDQLVAQDALPWPLRESALLAFVGTFSDLRRDQVPAELMARLGAWQPRTLVAHEEMATAGAALFPIAARAQGVENRWRRDEARALGTELLNQGAETFLTQWSNQADAAARAGLLDALDQASRDQLQALFAVAQGRAKSSSDFRYPAGRAALALRDVEAISTMIAIGADAQTRTLLQTAAEQLDADDMTAILAGLQRASATSQLALAIGVWSRSLAGQPKAEKLLLGLLDDAELGSSAALALALRPSPGTLAKLHARAAIPDNSLGARRARLALQPDLTSEMPR